MRVALFVFTASMFAAEVTLPPPASRKIDFIKDVQPLLEQKCYSCHGEEAQQSGLRLDRRQNALRGGDYGPVILVGKSAESKLIRRLVNGDGGLQMPPTGPLSNEEIGILRAWIDQGAEFLLEVKEAAPKPVDPKLVTLISAVRARDGKAVAKLIASSPLLVKAQDATGATALHHAAGFGDLATIKLILERGADVNAANRRKSTPLFWALREEAKVRLLLDRGANLRAKTIDGRTPLFQAASMANATTVLRLLLEKGADPNARTIIGMTPLMAACRANAEAARLLIAHGADVNAINSAGATALMAAAQFGRAETVRLLLDKGADPNARTKRNETALAEAATGGNENVVKLLLDRNVDVNVQDVRGYSALLYAAGSDEMPSGVVRMLLDKGARLDAKGDEETAAMLAAKRGDTGVARLLGVATREEKPPVERAAERPVADAVGPALALLEKQSHNFIRIGGCNSCHAQDLPSAAAAIARSRGLPAPKEIPRLPPNMHTVNPPRLMDLVVAAVAGPVWEMFEMGQHRAPHSEYTDASVWYLKSMQSAAGNWETPPARRPPMAAGTYMISALAAYSLRTYGPPAEKAETDQALAKAAQWFEQAKPVHTQDRAFRLLGLAWSNAQPAAIAAAARELAAMQRADGGWGQFTTLPADAYATGQALYALHMAGRMPTSDPVYANGVKYLLHTQAPDGSWLVKSRSIWLQPYFESGFPYGTDQWISAAGTAWASIALSLTVEPPQRSRETQLAARR